MFDVLFKIAVVIGMFAIYCELASIALSLVAARKTHEDEE